jgi:hypothetical protein
MRRLFVDQGRALYRTVNVQVLMDEHAPGEAIRAALKAPAGRIASQRVFVLLLAGHGASFERDYHFIPWDAVPTALLKITRKWGYEQFLFSSTEGVSFPPAWR